MPISFAVDVESRTVRTTAAGRLRSPDFAVHVNALAARGLLGHAQVIDARMADLDISTEEIRAFVTFIGKLRLAHGTARTAFVTSSDAVYGMLRMYQVLGADHDPGFAVFRDLPSAEEWVGGQLA